MIKVKNNTNLLRDPVSKAIINVDTAGLESYKTKKEIIKKKNEQIECNTRDIIDIKDDMDEIKNMLALLLNKYK